ncbi:MAG TPA: DNA polymerase III subunit gamma/tau [Thiotrichaceae bacterium]|nr:DNA polymerase III subunit gamma/tau [Thiotrichaceae bacterium]HIM08499.1 DNA polymerase III subunit gamma/tau [Gammaproteobacteria bacterium]
MSYQVLARKWRPRTFQDMVGQSHVLKTLSNALDQDRLHHAYLFSGTRGVGKTTLARILAKCLNCDNGVSSTPCGECNACVAIDEGRFIDLIEVDAASRAKVEETRDLMDNVQYAPTSGRYKVYLIDEIHMFSNHSFNALLKTLEEPPPHVKFLLATTEPKKLPVTILSRCLQFNLSHLTNDQIGKQVEMILGEESIKFDQGSVELVARGADGSMRDALSLLDQAIAYGGGALEESQVRAMMGTIESADLHGLIQALIDADPEALLNTIETIALQSPDFDSLLSELLSLLQKIAIIQVLPENSNNLLMTMKELVNFANAMNKEDTQLYYQIGMMGRKDLYLAPDPKSGFEMVMIRMLAFKPAAAGEITNKTQTLKPATNNTATSQTTSKPVTQAVVHTQVEPIAEVTANNTPAKKVDGNWQSMIEAMGLKGLTKELAGNCVIKSQTDIKLELALATSQEHLLNPSQKIRFEQAIKTYLGEEVKLSIVIENSDNETPAETNARVGRERQKVAENSMNSDSGVQSLLDTFNGAIDQDSIQPQ